MDITPTTLLPLALAGYVLGCAAGLLFFRHERLANLCSFGCATAAALCGTVACAMSLAAGATAAAPLQLQLLPTLIPYVQFTVSLDPLSAFFGLIVSLLSFALSLYSLGYARGFYGRKSVGALGAFFNLMLLATTLVVMADNAFFFLMVWEIMALSAYCLVSFEHEKPETRSAGVLYFVMSHIGTGCIMLGFLLLFQASGGYGFDGFHALSQKADWLSSGSRNCRISAVPHRFRHQGGHRAVAHLAAGGPSGRAQQRLRLHVRRAHQDRHLRPDARVFLFPRHAADVVGRGGAGRRHDFRRAGRVVRPDAA